MVGSSCRAAVACLRRSGFDAVAADQFADADLRQMVSTTQLSRYPDDIPQWLATTDATHWIYVGGIENHPDVISAAAAIRPLLGVDSPALPAIRDPFILQTRLAGAGFRFPQTQVEPPSEGRWLVKPRRSAGGLNIRAFSQPRPDADLLYQRFISGRCFGAAFVASSGKAQGLGVTRQLIGRKWGAPQPFQYAGSIGIVPLPASLLQQLQQLADYLAETTQLCGLFGIDFITLGDQLWPLEINPRFTAAMELLQADVMRLHLSACLPEVRSEQITVTSDSSDVVRGKLFVFAPCDFVWTESLESLLKQSAAEMSLEIADIPLRGSLIPQSAPVLTLLGSGSGQGALLRRLKQGSQLVRRWASR